MFPKGNDLTSRLSMATRGFDSQKRRFGSSKAHLSPPLSPGDLGCCPFKGGGSVVVVDFLFIVTPIVGVCNCSMF